MSDKPLALSDFNVALRKHVDPKSPAPLRMMAAKGLVPMAPQEMALVFFQLSFDDEAKISNAATESLSDMPEDLLLTACSAELDEVVLGWMAKSIKRRPDAVQALVTNRKTPGYAIAQLAERADAELSDLIAENQVRLLENPKIIEALYMNPRARMSTVDKLIDLAARNDVALTSIPALRPLMESRGELREVGEEQQQPEDDLFAQFLLEGLAEEEDLDDSDIAKLLGLGDSAVSEDDDAMTGKNRSYFLSRMSVSQKIRCATLGSISDRNYLIRDSNRLVHMSAVASPRNTDRDALGWSSNRNLPDSVVAYISNKRDWVKHYQVKLNLVNNPKLHLQKSLRLMTFLTGKDLSQLARNRNVPNTLARQAKVLFDKRRSSHQKK